MSTQIQSQFLSILLALLKPPGLSISTEDIEWSYYALSSFIDVIAMWRYDTSTDPLKVFARFHEILMDGDATFMAL